MKRILKQGIECMPAPLPILTEESLRYIRYPRLRRQWRQLRRILTKLPDAKRVAQGPFEGMGYIPLASSHTTLPMLLGTYERELHPAIEAICGAGCDRIVDIGAAEGYYAVGMALRNPGVSLVAFEMNASVRYYLRRLARRNGVRPRIKILGECTPAALETALAAAKRPAVICDCEGAEDMLLDPVRVPSLRRALILVETHEGMVNGIEDHIHKRFAATHDIEVIRNRVRTLDDLPAGCALSDAEADAAMDEHRRHAEWMFMQLKFG
jgi:precorrin-6B methylase 2